jgi:hypothetical protein
MVMSHHLLDRQQIATILNHQGRWRMPEEYVSTAGLLDDCLFLVVDH